MSVLNWSVSSSVPLILKSQLQGFLSLRFFVGPFTLDLTLIGGLLGNFKFVKFLKTWMTTMVSSQ